MIGIYKASCDNLKEIKRNQKQIKRMFNSAVLNNKHAEIKSLTKMYALIYSAFAEVAFLKMIHTPYGFSNDEIKQIQTQRNVAEKWNKCIELVFYKISKKGDMGQVQNKKKYLLQVLETYIIKPSQIRNKIAHGQWLIALNSDNTKVNQQITSVINDLDFVKIDVLFSVYQKFSTCIEDLLESPKTHYRDYYKIIADLELYITKTQQWDLTSKCERIKNTKKVFIKPI